MSIVADLAEFACRARWQDLSANAQQQLLLRVLDAFGCALGALDADPVHRLAAHLHDFGGAERTTLMGLGRSAPDRAALWNGFLVRYLDFNDSYLAPGETCHPSDNLAPVLAAAEYADASGPDTLAALAVAYQVQCRLSDEAPVRTHGFDHTTQGAYAVAAGVARALGLEPARAAHAIAIAGTANVALRVTRTGSVSNWKGLAYPYTAASALRAAFMARRGLTGPPEVFEGDKGFMHSIAGRFQIDWERENLERVTGTILKKFNAEIHSQSALEALIDLKNEHGFAGEDVEAIELDVFQVAYDIIGGGEEGDKQDIRTKEQADHALPYMLAVAALDGAVGPEQYTSERIAAEDVQTLMRRVTIRPAEDLSARFPKEHACRLRVRLAGGRTLKAARSDYEGFTTRPMAWDQVSAKLHSLGAAVDGALREELIRAVADLPQRPVRELARVLARLPSRVPAKHDEETKT